ncbi:hypothetical protein BaRGS_00015669 [Batillaria attramentaria]|uniref:Uncharacterized protein n=1 Tax=Batillaria attramentaria TaxID=370345 RepID=A0ABD0L0V4_9CAEN
MLDAPSVPSVRPPALSSRRCSLERDDGDEILCEGQPALIERPARHYLIREHHGTWSTGGGGGKQKSIIAAYHCRLLPCNTLLSDSSFVNIQLREEGLGLALSLSH